MIKQNRPLCPACLSHIQQSNNEEKLTNSVRWGKDWEEKHKAKKSFNWHKYQGENVDHLLLKPLRKMTKSHCSFCDKAMLAKDCDTIEHFKPKAIFHKEAFVWENLFLSCSGCQKSVKDWNEADRVHLLKPDEANYNFSKYFFFDSNTGEIWVQRRASSEDQYSASVTIQYFKMNDFDRPFHRRVIFEDYYDSGVASFIKNGFSLDKLAYRFIFS